MEWVQELRTWAIAKGSKQGFRLALGVALSLLGLALTFRNVRFPDLLAALAGGNYALVAIAIVVNLLAVGAIAMRWRLLFHPHKAPRFSHLLSGLMVAQLTNTVLPAHLGIVSRAYWIGGVGGVSKTFALGTIVLEKVVEATTLLPLLVLLPLILPFPSAVLQAGWSMGITLAALGLVMALLNRHKEGFSKFLAAPLSLFSKLGPTRLPEHLTSIIEGFSALRAKELWVRILGWTIGIWASTALSYYLALRAFHIQAPLVAVLLLLIVLQVGARAPALPSGVGVFHYLVVLILSSFSVEKNLAVSYALVLHAMTFLIPSILGAFCVWRVYWGPGQVRSFEAISGWDSTDG